MKATGTKKSKGTQSNLTQKKKRIVRMPEFLQPLKTVPVFGLVPAGNGDLTLGGEPDTLQKLFILGTRTFSKL
jgi:hypothetical protein